MNHVHIIASCTNGIIMYMQAWKEQFSEEKGFRTMRSVGFKFKTEGATDPCLKIIPQYSTQQCDIAMAPSKAEVKWPT